LKDKPTPEDPKTLALHEIANRKLAEKAATLLGFVEMRRGRKFAMALYKKCWIGKNFDLKVLRNHFTYARAREYGFYFLSRQTSIEIIGSAKAWTKLSEMLDGVLPLNRGTLKLPAGWWLYGQSKGSIYWRSDSNFSGKRFMDTLAKKTTYMGRHILSALPRIAKNFGRTRLSSSNATLLKKQLKDAEFYAGVTNKPTSKVEMAQWFMKQPEHKLIKLSGKEIGLMAMIYSRGCGSWYYIRKGTRIYVVKMRGTKTDPKWGNAGYIDIKGIQMGNWQYGKGSLGFLRRNLVEKMSEAELDKALQSK
jgi:hypothetical protein